MSTITWLHLSDWHQDSSNKNRSKHRQALLNDITDRIKIDPQLKKIDFILFSGDLAFNGKAQEYEDARKLFLDPLLKATSLSSDRLFLVPGNHDLDREMLPEETPIPFRFEELMGNWLNDERNRDEILKPFEAFRKFAIKYTKATQPDYAQVKRFEINGVKIGLLGLNSSLFSGQYKNSGREVSDYGHLVIGEHQLNQGISEVLDADIRIAVLHHPFEWLAEPFVKIIRDQLVKQFHFTLMGHQHTDQIYAVKGISGNNINFRAGVSYEQDRFSSSYNYVYLDLINGQGKMYLRTKEPGPNRKWEKDLVSSPNGMLEFSLEHKLASDTKSPEREQFHAFLSFQDDDRIEVKRIIKDLKLLGLNLWLPEQQVRPGDSWIKALGEALSQIQSIVVIIGANGTTQLQQLDLQNFLRTFVKDGKQIIFVFLQKVVQKPELPTFLQGIVSIDFRDSEIDPLNQLIWGITGKQTTISKTKPTIQVLEEPSNQNSPPKDLRILHLSDLHFKSNFQVMPYLQPLMFDLTEKKGLDVDKIDFLVISGDLGNYASPEEFQLAFEFTSQLMKRFQIPTERCMVVPGNHDVNWEADVYEIFNMRKIANTNLEKGKFFADNHFCAVRKEKDYHLRFLNFSKHFYEPLFNMPYPMDYAQQGISTFFENEKIQFLLLNSCWEIDEYFPERTSIHPNALSTALSKAREQIAQARLGNINSANEIVKIAVWHHPITGNEKMETHHFVELLRQAGFQLCLHGHVHEETAELLGHTNPEKLYVAGVGSFAAPGNARPESTPRIYQLLHIPSDRKKIVVHTRSRRHEAAAWDGLAIWKSSDGSHQPFYELHLND